MNMTTHSIHILWTTVWEWAKHIPSFCFPLLLCVYINSRSAIITPCQLTASDFDAAFCMLVFLLCTYNRYSDVGTFSVFESLSEQKPKWPTLYFLNAKECWKIQEHLQTFVVIHTMVHEIGGNVSKCVTALSA